MGVRSMALFAFVLLASCTERRLWVRTEPAGATVRVNGREVGVSPTAWRFDHYGRVVVEVEKDGYLAEQRIVRLKAPAREYWTLGGFVTDVLYPGTVRDDFEVDIKLEPEKKLTEDQANALVRDVAEAAARLRGHVESQER